LMDEDFPPIDDRDALHRLPPAVLEKASRPGRIRGIALETWTEARRDPARAGRALREGVRQARALHSRERRLVREGLYGMVRGHVRWTERLGTDDPLVLWLALLVEHGLPVEQASTQAAACFDRVGSPCGSLGRHHGISEAVVDGLIAALGADGARDFLSASDRRAPVTLRANLAVVSDREEAMKRLGSEGIQTVPGRHSPTALHLVGRANLQASRCFREGVVEVQDEGSQLLVDAVPEGARVWDVCAGAGGKALALAARGARVLASDVRGGALAETRRRAQRASVEVETVVIEANGALPAVVRGFEPDVVLVDAPCSGTGVLRRHPANRPAGPRRDSPPGPVPRPCAAFLQPRRNGRFHRGPARCW